MIALMIIPSDSATHWNAIAIWSKVIAIVGFYAVERLFCHWRNDRVIAAYLRWCDGDYRLPRNTRDRKEVRRNGNINK